MMSYTRQALYPCNPGTERGRSTKLSAANVKGSDKVIYANGRSVIVRLLSFLFTYERLVYLARATRFLISRSVKPCHSRDQCLHIHRIQLPALLSLDTSKKPLSRDSRLLDSTAHPRMCPVLVCATAYT
jgi:hypothetical protein